MKAATPPGAMPAKVFDSERAIVTAGLAKEVEAVGGPSQLFRLAEGFLGRD
jgi:hypothetical protein